MRYAVGIDLGGTNIAAGLVDENYAILEKASVKTRAPRPAGEITADMAELVRTLTARAGVRADAVGIGSPGIVADGVVRFAGNLKFTNVPLARMMEEALGLPCSVGNDANAAALGEHVAGAGKGADSLVMVTLGTGVGGGIIIDRKIYSGFNSNGAELGHTVIVADGRPCTCGRHGCWEAYASVTGLIADTRAAMLAHPESSMWKLENGSVENVSGKTAFIAAKAGDPVAEEVVRKYREYVAIGITNLVNIFQPEVLCVGGAISKEGEYLLAPIREFVERERYTRYCKQTEIKIASLGNDAGIIGAAMLGKSV